MLQPSPALYYSLIMSYISGDGLYFVLFVICPCRISHIAMFQNLLQYGLCNKDMSQTKSETDCMYRNLDLQHEANLVSLICYLERYFNIYLCDLV